MSEAGYAHLIAAAHQELHAPVILTSALTRAGRPRSGCPHTPRAQRRRGRLAVCDVDQFAAVARNRLDRIRHRPALIGGFLAQTGLALEPGPP
jgi:hypothetical protein